MHTVAGVVAQTADQSVRSRLAKSFQFNLCCQIEQAAAISVLDDFLKSRNRLRFVTIRCKPLGAEKSAPLDKILGHRPGILHRGRVKKARLKFEQKKMALPRCFERSDAFFQHRSCFGGSTEAKKRYMTKKDDDRVRIVQRKVLR